MTYYYIIIRREYKYKDIQMLSKKVSFIFLKFGIFTNIKILKLKQNK